MAGKQESQTDEEKDYYSLNGRVFRMLAPFYDLIAAPISQVRERVADLAGAKAGARALDVATGTGRQALAFARRGYDVTGIDLSVDMLRIACKKNKYPNLTFVRADATRLPFKGGDFDVSAVSFALHDMPAAIRQKALREIVRVTKPTGTIMVVDYALPRNKIGCFFIYNVVRLYEGRTYRDFIRSDPRGLLAEARIEVQEELPVVLGAGRVLRGTMAGHPSDPKPDRVTDAPVASRRSS